MGYYDGLDAVSMRCSTWELARLTRTPVILAADASGGAASVAAAVKGFQTLAPDSGIAGVLVNRVSGPSHYALVEQAVSHYTGLPCVGYLTKQQKLELPSRHLGLVTARETPDLLPRVRQAAQQAAETLDIDKILSLASLAPDLPEVPDPQMPDYRGFRLGVALDEAFHFYYQDNWNALRRAGMELVFFSPLRDAHLPEKLDGLYIGGGYPEVHAEGLRGNASLRAELRAALERGLFCYAECGGLMYLGREIDGVEMVGFLPLSCRMTDRLQRFGYVTVTDKSGLSFPAHEFHHAVAESDLPPVYTVRKASRPDKTWTCGYEKKNTLAAFAQVGAAAVGRVAPLDTHWIWQDGQNLLEDTPQIIGGKLQVPSKPGLGVTLNMQRVEEANRLYNSLPSHDRNDAMAMQYLIPGWKYDHKKPCLVR